MSTLKTLLARVRMASGNPFQGVGASSEHLSVYLSRGALATVYARSEEPLKISMRADPLKDLTELRPVLHNQLKQIGVVKRGAAQQANLVLAPEMYALSLLEHPEVPDDELATTMRWKMQDQLEYPVEDASIDVFPLPASASKDRRMVFVVAMPTDFLRSLISQVYASGVELTSIDIAELTLRNLAWHCFPLPDQSVAMLRLTANSGMINVSRGDELYLARRVSGVPADFSEDTWEEFRERMLLQVQRSIDYYESAMGQPPCNMLMVACTDGWTERVAHYLADMLPIPIRRIDEVLTGELQLDLYNPERQEVDLQSAKTDQIDAIAAGLPALGGVLRTRIARVEEDAA